MRFRVQMSEEREVKVRPIHHNTVQAFHVAQNDQTEGLTILLPGKISIPTANLLR
jgi:hypothetical protein